MSIPQTGWYYWVSSVTGELGGVLPFSAERLCLVGFLLVECALKWKEASPSGWVSITVGFVYSIADLPVLQFCCTTPKFGLLLESRSYVLSSASFETHSYAFFGGHQEGGYVFLLNILIFLLFSDAKGL